MQLIGIIGAMEQEVAILKAQLSNIETTRVARFEFHRGQLQGRDVVLVAGKGHETEQEIMGVRHPFSDVLHVQAALLHRADQRQGATA